MIRITALSNGIIPDTFVLNSGKARNNSTPKFREIKTQLELIGIPFLHSSFLLSKYFQFLEKTC